MAYELIIKNQVGTIQWDRAGLEKYVECQVQKYDNLLFTDAEMPEAKKTMAELNRLKKQIEDRRKEIKKEIAAPYTEFESQVKPIVQRIDEVRGKIETQVREYEQIRDEKKRQEIETWWTLNGSKSIRLDQVWDPRYLNVTFSMGQVIQDLSAKKERIRSDLALICQMSTSAEMTDYMIEDYSRNLDVQRAMQNWQNFEESRLRAERIKAEQEAARIAAEQARAADPEPVQVNVQETGTSSEYAPEQPRERHWLITFKVEGSHDQMVRLGNFMNSMKPQGFKYYVISKEEK